MDLISTEYLQDHGVTVENQEDVLEHYGTPRHSGRYPFGSGKNPKAAIKAGVAKMPKPTKEQWDAAFSPTVKAGKDKPNISPAEKVTKESGKIVNESEKIVDQAERLHRAKNKENLSDYSNKELQDMINRMRLEQQYEDLKASDTRDGYTVAKEVLETVGTIVGITGSVFAIISTVHSMRKKS